MHFEQIEMECQVKWIRCQKDPVYKHHIKYFPEETIAACYLCHMDIHSGIHTELTKYIKFKQGESTLFYSQKNRIDNFLQKLYRRRK